MCVFSRCQDTCNLKVLRSIKRGREKCLSCICKDVSSAIRTRKCSLKSVSLCLRTYDVIRAIFLSSKFYGSKRGSHTFSQLSQISSHAERRICLIFKSCNKNVVKSLKRIRYTKFHSERAIHWKWNLIARIYILILLFIKSISIIYQLRIYYQGTRLWNSEFNQTYWSN